MDRVLPSEKLPRAISLSTREFLKAIMELSFVVILGLFMTFGSEISEKD